jgi:hypothetical protein
MVAEDIADLFASWHGRASSGNADFGAIARDDFGPKNFAVTANRLKWPQEW